MSNKNNSGKDKTKKGDDKEINNGHKKEVIVMRRSRGRPRGSKNKPKPPIIVTTNSPNILQSHVIEFASGVDIAESLLCFAKTHQRGLCVLSATGTIANVTLQQAHGAIMVLHGLFGIITLTGLFFPPGSSPPGLTSLTICLASSQGRMIGGAVVGPLVASGPVMVMAAAFANAIYVRLPLPIKDNDKDGHSGDCGDGGGNTHFGKQSGGPSNMQKVKHETYSI